jgi:hypothetical protein
MSELLNDGRVWVPKIKLMQQQSGLENFPQHRSKKKIVIIILNAVIPHSETFVPRDSPHAAKIACDEGFGVNASGLVSPISKCDQRYGKLKLAYKAPRGR